MEILSSKLEIMIPELLAENGFPVHSKIKSRHTANAVLKQAGLKKTF
jgi:hypothetical protein